MVRVLIVGAGFAGLRAYSALRKRLPSAQVLLFDKENSFTYIPSLHLCLGNKAYVQKIQIPLQDALGASFIHEEVIKINKKEVITKKRSYAYDYLILATGSKTNFYGNKSLEEFTHSAKSLGEVQYINRLLPNAKTVTVVGGGLSGVEYSGMLATRTDKKITFISASKTLLPSLPKKAGLLAQKYLERKGVSILCNEKVSEATASNIILASGKTVESDLTILCAGILQKTPLLKTKEINRRLFLIKYPNIFVCGDVISSKAIPTAHNAMIEGEFVASQIARRAGSSNEFSKQRNWTTLAVALGPYYGLITTKKHVFALPFVGFLKLLVEKRVLFEFRHHFRLPI